MTLSVHESSKSVHLYDCRENRGLIVLNRTQWINPIYRFQQKPETQKSCFDHFFFFIRSINTYIV